MSERIICGVSAAGEKDDVIMLLKRCIDELEDNDSTKFVFQSKGKRVIMEVTEDAGEGPK